ncbi:sterol desaturase family protein [Limnobacter sp.]|uniref:sterol desaturase family protein n=1 Tax=Limnobacter sp. TaxID=2003368 RepID=UPI00273400BF|nr:sterol desaturase family protein [Limnobacter sp.]MDP3271371.1 sterol desaturase family protein [Limnobacter sp.]
MKNWVRLGAYPIVFGFTAFAQLLLLQANVSLWPYAMAIASTGLVMVALLERAFPYELSWNRDHADTLPDIFHAIFSLGFIFTSIEIVQVASAYLPVATVWPLAWPLWVQVIAAGLIIDFGLWFMHWLSHRNNFLWNLHALHHSAQRLYWLNGERRHPLSAILLAGPGTFLAIVLGAPAEVVGCWYSIIAVHLAFQHANLDYTVGPLKNILGVAEVHRWHHKKEYEDAQVNFGEFWMIWDQIFGTFHHTTMRVEPGDVGMRENMPTTYWKQIIWPFQRTS